jgi:serine/threonine-protein kinase
LGNEEFCPKDGMTLMELEGQIEDPLVGVVLDGRYQVERKLGEGGMGVVYLATHVVIGKRYALKVLRGEMATEKEVAERFTQEARAAASIGNEHIIEITDFGRAPDGAPYFVMELLDGKELHDLLEQSPQLEVNRSLRILAQCCDALAAAHSIGIIHRDLKPENIFLVTRSGNPDFVKVLDFGIAKVARESGRLTRTGMIFGTPQYMSPEQAAGTDIDSRTDIYSLGIIMYEMLCGRVPFEADTFMGVLTKHLYEEPIPPKRLVPAVNIPTAVEAVLLKAIAKKPDRRYGSMIEFAEDIRSILDGKTPSFVYDQMRELGTTTLPPPPPSEIVKGRSPRGAVSEGLPSFRPKWPIFAGVGAAVVVVLALVAGLFMSSGSSDKANAQNVPLIPAMPLPVATDAGAGNQGDKAVSAEDKPANLVLISEPTGAALFKEGALLGTTPLQVLRPGAEQSHRYTLKLEGFADADVIINSATPNEYKVKLKEVPVSKPLPSETTRASGKSRTKKTEAQKAAKPAGDKTRRKAPQGDIADPWAQ